MDKTRSPKDPRSYNNYSLSSFYQVPVCLDPLDADQDKIGEKSDHKIVVAKPINVINNKSGRTVRKIKVRPFPESGMLRMKDWFQEQSWEKVLQADSAHDKAQIFQNMLSNILDEIFPEKLRKISNDDQLPVDLNQLK